MKTLLAAFALAFCACRTSQIEQVPPVEFETGFTFSVPCNEHGTDEHIVSGTYLLRVYSMSVNGEPSGEAFADQIKEVLTLIGAMQNDPQ